MIDDDDLIAATRKLQDQKRKALKAEEEARNSAEARRKAARVPMLAMIASCSRETVHDLLKESKTRALIFAQSEDAAKLPISLFVTGSGLTLVRPTLSNETFNGGDLASLADRLIEAGCNPEKCTAAFWERVAQIMQKS